MSTDRETIQGRIVELLPNLEFKVELADGRTVRCYSSGKLRMNKIRIVIGDKVSIVYPQGSSVGRVVRRI